MAFMNDCNSDLLLNRSKGLARPFLIHKYRLCSQIHYCIRQCNDVGQGRNQGHEKGGTLPKRRGNPQNCLVNLRAQRCKRGHIPQIRHLSQESRQLSLPELRKDQFRRTGGV